MTVGNGSVGVGVAGELFSNQRFPCAVCGKSYLRKRHLQRHMRDECIGIPPRFSCDYCPSRFRRKYHMVRHLISKHDIPPEVAQQTSGGGQRNHNNAVAAAVAGGTNGGGGGAHGIGSNGDINMQNQHHMMRGATAGMKDEKTDDDEGEGSIGSGSSHNGCNSPIPENLSMKKEHYENTAAAPPPPPPVSVSAASPITASLGQLPIITPQIMAYGTVTGIPATAIGHEEIENNGVVNAALAATIGCGITADGDAINGAVGGLGVAIKAEPMTPGKTGNSSSNIVNIMDDDWKMKLSLQLISNSLLKERLMNTMPFSSFKNN